MTTQAGVLEQSSTETVSVRPRSGTASSRVLGRWIAGVAVLAIMAALLVGWVNQARAATTDRLETLSAQIDERVAAGRASSDRLASMISTARNVQADSAEADPATRDTLDAAIRSAETIVDQHLTTQDPATVPQAEMLMEQAGHMEEALALAATDLRTAVDRVRVSRGDFENISGDLAAHQEESGVRVAVAGP